MNTQDAISGWRSWMTAAGRPETTVNLRCYQLERVARDVELGSATVEDLAGWIAGHQWSPETKRSWRAAMIGFYRWAVLTGRTPANPALELPVVRVPRKKARPAPELVIAAALVGADARLWLMVNLAWRCGLRRGEIAQVNGADLLEDAHGTVLVVHGKGGKERMVPVPADVTWRVREACRQHEGGWAFAGAIEGHLSARRVGELVAEALPGGWTCHTLRHRFGTSSYATSGGDLVAVQELLGHAKPETTRLYVELPSESLWKATSWAA
jgi:integrase